VMYAGMIVEAGPAMEVFAAPAHPYTEGLMFSIPKIGDVQRGTKLHPIRGNVPNPTEWPVGCRFHPRCPYMRPACLEAVPSLEAFGPGRWTRCFFAREIFGKER
jgi:oligopeptide/dipeptide ABC transporter ATP-binding protein